jgi:hypothetical protein
MASLIETDIGPYGNKTHVLCMQNKMDDPDHGSTSRNEYSFFMKSVPNGYVEGYVKYWMKLQNNLKELVPKGKASPWYMIMEWKEPNSGIRKSSEECRKIRQGPGGSNNYRININIRRGQDASRFRWYITGEHPQPCRKTEWMYLASESDVPLGRWFLVEAYMKQHATEGRVYFAVDGRLYVNADTGQFRQSTVWLDRVFSGNLRVEYDACVLASTDAANNMNFFFLYSGASDKPLYASRQARSDGRYPKYHGLNGYIFTNVANGSGSPARFRFRDCPGFNLPSEGRKY